MATPKNFYIATHEGRDGSKWKAIFQSKLIHGDALSASASWRIVIFTDTAASDEATLKKSNAFASKRERVYRVVRDDASLNHSSIDAIEVRLAWSQYRA